MNEDADALIGTIQISRCLVARGSLVQGAVDVGHLYDSVEEIDRVCRARGLDAIKVKGEISMKSGFFLAIVFPHTPDDDEKLDRLRAATKEVLGVSLGM